MTTLVFIVTAVFSLYIPQTRGYFNIGEAAVYISALILNPMQAWIAGGVGSMMADVALGYFYYAPATLIIKGCEAAIASTLVRRKPRSRILESRLVGTGFSMLLPLLIGLIGSRFYVGSVELSFSIPLTPLLTIGIGELAQWTWVVIAIIIAAFLVYTNLKRVGTSWTILSLTTSGMVMVLGYYLYEQLVLGVAAIAEVPFNLMQVLVGITACLMVEEALKPFSRLVAQQ